MARISGIYLVLASFCFVFNVALSATTREAGHTSTREAEHTTTTEAEHSSSKTTEANLNYPVDCQEAVPQTVKLASILGTWYEAARKPVGGGQNIEECVQLVISSDNGNITAAETHSLSPTYWVNQTMDEVILDIPAKEQMGEVLGEWTSTSAGVTTTYKVLDTDYNTYTFVCGYVSVAVAPSKPAGKAAASNVVETTTVDNKPAGAFILTRVRQINDTQLATFIENAKVDYTDFEGLSTVVQSSKCVNDDSSASTAVPALAMVMAMVCSVLKFVR